MSETTIFCQILVRFTRSYKRPARSCVRFFDLGIINTLKSEILNAFDDEYWSSITTLHWIATYLESAFNSLTFVDKKEE